MPESTPPRKNLLGAPDSPARPPSAASSHSGQQERRYRERNERESSSSGSGGKFLLMLVLLCVLGGAGYGYYAWANRPVEVATDHEFIVVDKLLIPGQLLNSYERSALGHRKTRWEDPKFVFTLRGVSTGLEMASEVPESLFLHVPRNTRLPRAEVEAWPTLVSRTESRSEPELLPGLSRFSTAGPR